MLWDWKPARKSAFHVLSYAIARVHALAGNGGRCQHRLKLTPWCRAVVTRAVGGYLPEVSVFGAVAVSFEAADAGILDEPIGHAGVNDAVAEDFASATCRRVCCW